MPWLILYFFLLIFAPADISAEPTCGVKLTFIDVGEGESIVVEQSDALPFVIDTGNPVGGFKTVEYLKSRNIQALTAVLLTHPHLDHIGGVFALLKNFSAEKLYDNGQGMAQESNMNDMYRWYGPFFRTQKNYSMLRRGASLKIGKVDLSVLWPRNGELDSDWNNNSIVLKLRFGEFKALLTGDSLEATEQALLREKIDLKANVLKLGHHGSRHASSSEFVASVQPSAVVVSVDTKNSRGYPDEEKLHHISTTAKLLRTDRNGTITICAQQDGSFSTASER